MTIYLDRLKFPWRGKNWTHMIADEIEELHIFAAQIGVRRDFFEEKSKYPHYDIDMCQVQIALARGAIFLEKRKFIELAKKLSVDSATPKIQKDLFD